MAKKTKLLALAAVSAAMLAVPALASAQTAHIDVAEPFTISGGAYTLNETGGLTITGTSISGTGTFINTTTGTMTLKTSGVTESIFGTKCGSTAQGHTESSGVVTTTELTFHLIMLATNKPGILITPNAATGVFKHFKCLGIEKTVTGNGLIGTITSPGCGVASKTATVSIRRASAGHQEHKLYTGVNYSMHTNSSGNPTASYDIPGNATLTFANARKIECTHVA
jgi:hypothetical protein